MSTSRLATAFESIDFQRQSSLYKELSIHFDNAIQTGNPVKALKQGLGDQIANAILEKTGIKIVLLVSDSTVPNAFVNLPLIDRNHPLLIDFFREFTDNRDGLNEIRRNDGILTGGIDRHRARVSGKFSEIVFRVGLTRGLLAVSTNFTASEIAGILLHEIGHVFTYFEYLGTNITTNYILQHTTRQMLDTREIKRKYQIIEDTEKALGIEFDDTDALVREQNQTVIQTVILRQVVKKRYSELDSHTYDMTAWEMLADQFANRHGAGRDLVTGLDKLHRTAGSVVYKNIGGYLATEAFKMLLLVVSTPLSLGLIPFLALFVIDPNEDLYDAPEARIKRLRRDMVDALKDQDASDDYKQQMVQDIEVVDKVLEEMQDRKTFLQTFWTTVWPRSRHNYKQLKFQQELEMLVQNDVFVKASKLKTLNL